MYHYLKDLGPTHQIGALFVLVFGLLLICSVVVFALTLREHADERDAAPGTHRERRLPEELLRALFDPGFPL